MTSALDLALEFAALPDSNGIAYALGGSLASSAVGEPRTTMDVDMAVRLDDEQLDAEQVDALLSMAGSLGLSELLDAAVRAE